MLLLFQCLFSLSDVKFVSVTSMRLAYKDLELQRKRDEEKLRGLEGKKKEQAERLGMGFSHRRSGILIHAIILKFGIQFHTIEVCCVSKILCYFGFCIYLDSLLWALYSQPAYAFCDSQEHHYQFMVGCLVDD